MVTGSPDPPQARQNRSGHALAPNTVLQSHLARPCTDFPGRLIERGAVPLGTSEGAGIPFPGFPSTRALFFRLTLECRVPPPKAVGPLGRASSQIRCCVTHPWPSSHPHTLSRSLESVALVHLYRSRQAEGGAQGGPGCQGWALTNVIQPPSAHPLALSGPI